MINIIWACMIIIGIITAIITGNIDKVNEAVISSSEEAVSLCITMLGIVSMWNGIMNIAEKSGLMKKWSEKMKPVMKFLFPAVSPDSPAYTYMCTNIIANICGLGWAATPPALKAMKELAKKNHNPDRPSREMSIFLILNISSLQLIPVSIIAYRTKYGATNPAGIILPGLIATLCSTLAAVIICIIINYKSRK
jgi:spore maturation protein A